MPTLSAEALLVSNLCWLSAPEAPAVAICATAAAHTPTNQSHSLNQNAIPFRESFKLTLFESLQHAPRVSINRYIVTFVEFEDCLWHQIYRWR